jgi:hypothetical protein
METAGKNSAAYRQKMNFAPPFSQQRSLQVCWRTAGLLG